MGSNTSADVRMQARRPFSALDGRISTATAISATHVPFVVITDGGVARRERGSRGGASQPGCACSRHRPYRRRFRSGDRRRRRGATRERSSRWPLHSRSRATSSGLNLDHLVVSYARTLDMSIRWARPGITANLSYEGRARAPLLGVGAKKKSGRTFRFAAMMEEISFWCARSLALGTDLAANQLEVHASFWRKNRRIRARTIWCCF